MQTENIELAYKHVDAYFKYMFNNWDYSKSITLFGEDRGDYLWGLWREKVARYGHVGAIGFFWSQVDSEIRKTLVSEAVKAFC